MARNRAYSVNSRNRTVRIVCGSVVAVVFASFVVEWFAWGIIKEELTIDVLFTSLFWRGLMETIFGAIFFGFLPLTPIVLFPRSRKWLYPRLSWIWLIGAAFFLLAMAGLIIWAPKLYS